MHIIQKRTDQIPVDTQFFWLMINSILLIQIWSKDAIDFENAHKDHKVKKLKSNFLSRKLWSSRDLNFFR